MGRKEIITMNCVKVLRLSMTMKFTTLLNLLPSVINKVQLQENANLNKLKLLLQGHCWNLQLVTLEEDQKLMKKSCNLISRKVKFRLNPQFSGKINWFRPNQQF